MRRRVTVLLLAAWSVTARGAEDGVLIEVFTDATLFPVTSAGTATVYDLSAPRRLAADLGRGLPREPAAAETAARARIAGAGTNLRAAYEGPAKALGYGLAKIPAVVFGQGQSVVYGVTDVAAAIQLYRRWREGR
jgi:integrating conjugative element protein (TIGR03757 family)